MDFLASDILINSDIIISQETNLHSVRHVNYDNLGQVGWFGLNLSTTDSGEYCRGSLIATNTNNGIPKPVKIKIGDTESKFDIRAASISFSNETVIFISAYRSPSMSDLECIEFFDHLTAVITEFTGKIILVGDLNIASHRPFRYGLTENIFLDTISKSGLDSKFTGPTRESIQLDYAFSNFGVNVGYGLSLIHI